MFFDINDPGFVDLTRGDLQSFNANKVIEPNRIPELTNILPSTIEEVRLDTRFIMEQFCRMLRGFDVNRQAMLPHLRYIGTACTSRDHQRSSFGMTLITAGIGHESIGDYLRTPDYSRHMGTTSDYERKFWISGPEVAYRGLSSSHHMETELDGACVLLSHVRNASGDWELNI